MNIINYNSTIKIDGSFVATVGNFDGVHLGHRILIEKVVSRARIGNLRSMVVTFEPHTSDVIKEIKTPRITTLDEKLKLIEMLGVDTVIVINFDKSMASLTKEQFLKEIIVEKLHVVELIMGENHRFGSKTKKVEKELLYRDEINDIKTTKIKLYGENSITAGSTLIRKYLIDGEFDKAVNLLGHPYLIQVARVRGVQKGTEMGFPTLNFSLPPSQKIVPLVGVYVAEITFRDITLRGCLYFGDCPTFGDRDLHFEFYSLDLVDVDPEIGEECMIWVHHFVRPDREFSNQEELIQQIDNDVKVIKNFFVKG